MQSKSHTRQWRKEQKYGNVRAATPANSAFLFSFTNFVVRTSFSWKTSADDFRGVELGKKNEATKSEYFLQYLFFSLFNDGSEAHTYGFFPAQRKRKWKKKKHKIARYSHLITFATFHIWFENIFSTPKLVKKIICSFFYFCSCCSLLEACKFAMYIIWCVYFQFPTNAIFKYASCIRTWRSIYI